jgi:hypothetical protein
MPKYVVAITLPYTITIISGQVVRYKGHRIGDAIWMDCVFPDQSAADSFARRLANMLQVGRINEDKARGGYYNHDFDPPIIRVLPTAEPTTQQTIKENGGQISFELPEFETIKYNLDRRFMMPDNVAMPIIYNFYAETSQQYIDQLKQQLPAAPSIVDNMADWLKNIGQKIKTNVRHIFSAAEPEEQQAQQIEHTEDTFQTLTDVEQQQSNAIKDIQHLVQQVSQSVESLGAAEAADAADVMGLDIIAEQDVLNDKIRKLDNFAKAPDVPTLYEDKTTTTARQQQAEEEFATAEQEYIEALEQEEPPQQTTVPTEEPAASVEEEYTLDDWASFATRNLSTLIPQEEPQQPVEELPDVEAEATAISADEEKYNQLQTILAQIEERKRELADLESMAAKLQATADKHIDNVKKTDGDDDGYGGL